MNLTNNSRSLLYDVLRCLVAEVVDLLQPLPLVHDEPLMVVGQAVQDSATQWWRDKPENLKS